ncbi:MAG: hypothetical protein ABL961_18280, partial [Vicinamibacterales bacterium]
MDYVALFASAFLAATILPLASEVPFATHNAGVRLFRAPEALRRQAASCATCAEHGCVGSPLPGDSAAGASGS